MMYAVHIDGWLYYGIAVSGALQTGLAQEGASNYIPQPYLFYIQLINGAFFLAGLTALKTFRSTAYADHVANGNGHIVASKTSQSTTKVDEGKVTTSTATTEVKNDTPPSPS